MTAVDSRETAEHLTASLLEARLAACVQIIGPVSSRYWWNGSIERAEEWLCLVKTREGLYQAVEAAILAVHPYENPEILCIPVSVGNEKYVAWLTAQTFG
jgi:periplasmic divalent cation tolerance protein